MGRIVGREGPEIVQQTLLRRRCSCGAVVAVEAIEDDKGATGRRCMWRGKCSVGVGGRSRRDVVRILGAGELELELDDEDGDIGMRILEEKDSGGTRIIANERRKK